MVARVGDPAGAEAAVNRWLTTLGESQAVGDLRAAWASFAPKDAIIHTSTQAKARREGRSEALRAAIPGLVAELASESPAETPLENSDR